MEGARKILLSITGGPDLSLWEVNEAAKAVAEAAHPDANIIFGAMVDEKLDDQVWVTVVATGYGDGRARAVAARVRGAARRAARRAPHGPRASVDDAPDRARRAASSTSRSSSRAAESGSRGRRAAGGRGVHERYELPLGAAWRAGSTRWSARQRAAASGRRSASAEVVVHRGGRGVGVTCDAPVRALIAADERRVRATAATRRRCLQPRAARARRWASAARAPRRPTRRDVLAGDLAAGVRSSGSRPASTGVTSKGGSSSGRFARRRRGARGVDVALQTAADVAARIAGAVGATASTRRRRSAAIRQPPVERRPRGPATCRSLTRAGRAAQNVDVLDPRLAVPTLPRGIAALPRRDRASLVARIRPDERQGHRSPPATR